MFFFFFSSRRRHTSSDRDWSSDVCSSDLGGRHEPGESIEETAIREAKEETNFDVELGELIGEYSIVSAGGERILDVSIFIATILGGEMRPQEGEIDDIGWFDPNRLPHPMTNAAPPAIADAVRGARGVHRRVVSAH